VKSDAEKISVKKVQISKKVTTMFADVARYTRLPPLTCIPRFLLGEVPRLGLDRADSRGSVALIFVLFRDSFKGILPFFWWAGRNLEGPRNYPTSVIRSLPSVSGRRGDLPMLSVNSKGHSHRSDVRHPPTRVLDKARTLKHWSITGDRPVPSASVTKLAAKASIEHNRRCG